MTRKICKKLIILSCCFLSMTIAEESQKKDEDTKKEDIWEQDLTNAFKIDASTKGLQKVHLKCGAESMMIELETEEDFNGVMYTRGSFYKQNEPCFVRPNLKKGSRALAMKFPLNQCQTLNEGDVFSNVIVIQHDPDLVTPGDAAFTVECDFRKPRSMTVNADMQARDRHAYGSRITLTSPDPSSILTSNSHGEEETVSSDSDSVTFEPKKLPTKQKVKGTVESVKIETNDGQKDEL